MKDVEFNLKLYFILTLLVIYNEDLLLIKTFQLKVKLDVIKQG